MTNSFHEIVAAGQKLYDETLKVEMEPLHRGKLLALDIDTGKYVVGDDTLSVFDELKEQEPAATIYMSASAIRLPLR